jgi:hypothetical protein
LATLYIEKENMGGFYDHFCAGFLLESTRTTLYSPIIHQELKFYLVMDAKYIMLHEGKLIRTVPWDQVAKEKLRMLDELKQMCASGRLLAPNLPEVMKKALMSVENQDISKMCHVCGQGGRRNGIVKCRTCSVCLVARYCSMSCQVRLTSSLTLQDCGMGDSTF